MPKASSARVQPKCSRRRGALIFTAGSELDRFVVWDYIKMQKTIVA